MAIAPPERVTSLQSPRLWIPQVGGIVCVESGTGFELSVVVSSYRAHQQFWKLVPPTVVAVCSIFAAHALANVVSQTVFPENAVAFHAPSERPAPVEPSSPRSKDASSLVDRNMFCSGCLPEASDQTNREVLGIATHRPLRLIATNISTRDSRSFASVLNTQSLRQGAYRMGQSIPGAGIVRRIGHDFVEFRSEDGNRVERVQFDTGGARVASVAKPSGAGKRDGSSLAEEFVRSISDTHFEVDRELVGKVRGNPRLAGARAMPVHKKGAMAGVRLSAVRTKGLAHAVGLRNGDTIRAANGVKLSSAEAGLELLGQLATRDHWNFEIERRGKMVQLVVDLQ